MSAADILARLTWSEDGLPVGWPADQGVMTGGADVLAWAEMTLSQPDGPRAGEHWEWRDSQIRFVLWWYALDDDGEYLWRRSQICLPKGTGKSPLAAAIGCAELAGPVCFVDWDPETGEPVMRTHPSPDVKLSALSADQAADATMSLAVAMLDNEDALAEVSGLDAGITRIRTRAGKLTSATAMAASKEGLRNTAVILDEVHLWTRSNGGHRLAETLRRAVAKTGGRSLETTNAWAAGDDSVAERTATYAEAVRAGEHRGDGVLTWRPIGHCEDLSDPVELRAGLAELYADSPWVDIDRIAAEIIDGGSHPSDSRRYWLNQQASADDAWLSQPEWAACLDRSKPLEDGDVITLGFDGSHGRVRGNADATALVAVRVEDGHVQLIDCWQAPEGDKAWQVPDALVDAAVRMAFEKYKPIGFYADPSGWTSELAAWERDYSRKLTVKASANHATHYWASRAWRMVQALAAFSEAVTNGDMTHDGSYRLTQHVLNARRNPTRRAGLQISKAYPDSPDKIDAAIAATLAWQARLDAVAKGATGKAPGAGKGRVIVLQ